MTRRHFACARCGVVLAVVVNRSQPALLIAPGVGHVVNLVYRTVSLRCACGQVEAPKLPKRVSCVIVEERRAA